MTYQQTLDFLYQQLPMFHRQGAAAYRKDLHNTRRLCEALGHPEQKFRSIHVGGTNGKGSVSHMLAAVLQAAGHRTGLYTSPHLYDFRERIRIDGQMIGEAFVVDFTEQMRPLIHELQPSFFELTVAMAFEYFAAQDVDIAVIEVGLGGRLDSTNVIHPELSVITNIGHDHMNLLGDTLEAIASEKAGIIKPGVPVVIGERQGATDTVFIKAAEKAGAPIFFAEDRFQTTITSLQPDRIELEVDDKEDELSGHYTLDLPGSYQAKNIRTALKALSHLPHLRTDQKRINTALRTAREKTGLGGRWEVIRREPLTILEVAHNPEGIRQMLAHLAQLTYQRLRLVLGMVKDKDIASVLQLLPAGAQYYFTQAHIPRALPAAELQQAALPYSLTGNIYPDVNTALNAALDEAAPDDLILVCGSIFLVAEVKR